MKDIRIKMEAREVLLQLIDCLNLLTIDEYTKRISLLGNATIGEHTRHIVELFQQLHLGYESEVINYDERKRDIRLQENINFAIETIAGIVSNLCKENKNISLITLYNNHEAKVESNYVRELMYNIEHCIHHQAIIKVGLLLLDKPMKNENFGYAKSTIEYKKQCAQ